MKQNRRDGEKFVLQYIFIVEFYFSYHAVWKALGCVLSVEHTRLMLPMYFFGAEKGKTLLLAAISPKRYIQTRDR